MSETLIFGSFLLGALRTNIAVKEVRGSQSWYWGKSEGPGQIQALLCDLSGIQSQWVSVSSFYEMKSLG